MADDVKSKFRDFVAKDSKIKRLLAKEKPDYLDADEYGIRIGEILGDIIDEDTLEEFQELMIDDHTVIADYTKDVQNSLNHEAGIHMQALSLPINRDRLDGLVKFAETIDEINSELKESIINFNQNIVTDSIERNAEFQYEAGLKPKIVRRFFGGCDWCREVAGSYRYPDVPHDVYRRHKRCRCTVNYYPGNGRRQNVWTKKYSEEHAEEIQERRINNINYSSRRIVDKLSKKYVANGIKSNKIKDEINVDKQLPHLEQTAKNNRSYIYGDLNRAKKLYDKYKGTGYSLIDTDGKWNNKEFVNTNEKIGRYSNEDGSIAYDSRQLVIIYSKTGVHIYPGKKRYYD